MSQLEQSYTTESIDPTFRLLSGSIPDDVSLIVDPRYIYTSSDHLSQIQSIVLKIGVANKKPEKSSPQNVDVNLYNSVVAILSDIKKITSKASKTSDNSEIRDAANPFENIGNSVFINRAAVKLANIDAVFGVSGYQQDAIENKSAQRKFYADIAAGPGGFSEYLLWRNPDAFVFGITLKHKEGSPLNWRRDEFHMDIDLRRFQTTDGADGTGNLYNQKNIDEFVEFILSPTGTGEGVGVNLAVADGGLEVEDHTMKEIQSMQLLICQVMTALRVIKVGGNFVCKYYSGVEKTTSDLFYILSLMFRSICLFNPITSRPGNNEHYIICFDYLYGPTNYDKNIHKLLSTANTVFNRGKWVSSLISSAIPQEFLDYITNMNNIMLTNQEKVVKTMLEMAQGRNPSVPSYDLLRCYQVWNIPYYNP